MLLRKIISTAAEKRFSIETKSSPYGYYNLNEYEMAFLCNHCGEPIILSLFDEDFDEKVGKLVCKSDQCFLDEDLITWTQNETIAWCYDELNVMSIKMNCFNLCVFENGQHFNFPESGENEVYIAPDPMDSSFAYAFVVYPNETDAWLSKYLLFKFKVSTWGIDTQDVSICLRWPYFYKNLYDSINANLQAGKIRQASTVAKAFDCYIDIHHAIRKNNKELWCLSLFCKTIAKVSEILDKYAEPNEKDDIKDWHLRHFIRLHSCPVCHEPYKSSETKCEHCQFPELNRMLISKDDAIYWEKNVLAPYKAAYEQKNSQSNKETNQEVIASEERFFNVGYDHYSALYTLFDFYNSSTITRVVVPDKVERIDYSVFAGYSNLSRVDLPVGLREIGHTAFSECANLQYIIIPATVKKIGSGAFQKAGLKAIFSEAPSKPSGWTPDWKSQCRAKVYWKNEWYYDKNGNPVINKQ